MRISDWSSDVCSSDLSEGEIGPHTAAAPFARLDLIDDLAIDVARVEADAGVAVVQHVVAEGAEPYPFLLQREIQVDGAVGGHPGKVDRRVILLAAIDIIHAQGQIGSASCRERGCQYVEIWVGG